MKNLEQLLKKTTNIKPESSQDDVDTLAGQLSKFDKADQIINQINHTKETKSHPKKDKMEYVTYAIPETFIKTVNDIIKKCMREELAINKSEIIRLGIQLVSALSIDELIELLQDVKVERGRPKL